MFSSCTANITGEIKTGGRTELTIDAGLQDGITALIASFSGKTGADTTKPIIDADEINRSFGKNSGIDYCRLKNQGKNRFSGSIAITNIGEFLKTSSKNSLLDQFIVYEQTETDARITITLNKTTGNLLLSNISPDLVDYISSLMAPVATGEELSGAEYLELVTSVYGEKIAKEIGAARITAEIDVPAIIFNVEGGTFKKRRASFGIPLIDILVLEKPLVYKIEWHYVW